MLLPSPRSSWRADRHDRRAIARTRGTKTRLGAFLDQLADKLLLTASFVTLTYKFPRVLPFWLTAIVLGRDLLLILVPSDHATGGQLNPTPTPLGKASTVFQMVTVGVALFVVGGGHDFWPVRKALLIVAAVLTIGSGIQYLVLAPRYVDWADADAQRIPETGVRVLGVEPGLAAGAGLGRATGFSG